jgi:hypothetical protein
MVSPSEFSTIQRPTINSYQTVNSTYAFASPHLSRRQQTSQLRTILSIVFAETKPYRLEYYV